MTQQELKFYAIQQAEELRGHLNKSETYLWDKLKRHNKKYGTKWQCQVPIIIDLPVKRAFKTKPFYIADFVEMEHKVIIEVDGPHHDFCIDKRKDHTRDTALDACGFRTYRIDSLDVWRKAVLKPFLDKVYNTEALSPWYA
jgi:very-short-patch-repair endonuclease